MHKWISVLLAGVMCVLMVGCTKTTTVTVLSENDSTNIPSVTSATERVTVSSSASTHTTSTKATTNLTTALTTSRENTQPPNGWWLIVNGKDITEGNYVGFNTEHQVAENPLIAIMEELGVEVKRTGKTFTFTYNEKQHVIDTREGALGIPVLPGSTYSCRQRVLKDIVVDHPTMSVILRWVDATLRVDYDEKTVTIEQ